MVDGIDVREVPRSAIAVPTLAATRPWRPGDPDRASSPGQATAIAGATSVEHDGIDHFPHVGETDWWLDALERFLTGDRRPTSTARERQARADPHSRRVRGVPRRLRGSARGVGFAPGANAVQAARGVRRRTSAREAVDRVVLARRARSCRRSRQAVRAVVDRAPPARRRRHRRRRLGASRPREVELDLADLLGALRDGDDEGAATLYIGDFLPEDVYAQWAAAPTRSPPPRRAWCPDPPRRHDH